MSVFKANEVEYTSDFSPIPVGKYSTTIVAAEEKTAREGGGTYLDVQLEINDGDHAGRKIFDKITITNQKDQAVDIGRQNFKRILESSNLEEIDAWTDLIMATAHVSVKHEQYNGNTYARVGYYMTPKEMGLEESGPIVKRTIAHKTPGAPQSVSSSMGQDEPPF